MRHSVLTSKQQLHFLSYLCKLDLLLSFPASSLSHKACLITELWSTASYKGKEYKKFSLDLGGLKP